MRKVVLLLTMAGCAALSAQASVIFVDGFNFAGTPPASFTTVTSGALGPWTVGGSGVDRIGGLWQTAEGNGSVDMSALNAGTLHTNLSTVAGQSYLLSFYLAGNTSGPIVKSLNVQAGSLNQTFTFDVTGHSRSSMGWTLQSALFTATSSVTVLTFASLTNNASGPALDGVTVETASLATPEPNTDALGLLGLLGLLGFAGFGLFRRRRA